MSLSIASSSLNLASQFHRSPSQSEHKRKASGGTSSLETTPAAASKFPRTPLVLHLSFSSQEGEEESLSQEVARKVEENVRIPFAVRFDSSANRGNRAVMEDAHFHVQIPGGYLMGIFDGHGEGGRVAKMASEYFQTEFPKQMEYYPNNVDDHFAKLYGKIHEKVNEPVGGTTALVCFLDTGTNELIAGGVGDSEVTVFRKVDGGIIFFTLPTKRTWGDPEEASRVEKAFRDKNMYRQWMKQTEKHRYFPPIAGVNVSRSLGDKKALYEGRGAIIQTPVMARFSVQSGDLIVLGCDGLGDFVTPKQLVEEVIRPSWDDRYLAQKMVQFALNTSTDNVSVICARVQDKPFEPSPPLPSTLPVDEDVE